ncbi:hypothetical protein [Flavobacterium sp.]|uniref:hypothetical protein n=1 Tax=Flavobacterium sp. TaxID=239 RepID=UPI003D6B1B6F
MKNVLILFLFLSNSSFGQKQINYTGFNLTSHNPKITDLQGKWGIDLLITDKKTKEYKLNYTSADQGIYYGNSITLKPDRTFVSAYSAPCGNDCFTRSIGKYKIIDENYICLFLEKINRSGYCTGNSITNEVNETNEDLGLFRIYKDGKKMTLIKSDGNLQNDEKNLQYIDLLVSRHQKIFEYYDTHNFPDWTTSKSQSEEEITALFMAQNQIENYKILYSKTFILSATTIILVKAKNEYLFLLCQSVSANDISVVLLEDSFFSKN